MRPCRVDNWGFGCVGLSGARPSTLSSNCNQLVAELECAHDGSVWRRTWRRFCLLTVVQGKLHRGCRLKATHGPGRTERLCLARWRILILFRERARGAFLGFSHTSTHTLAAEACPDRGLMPPIGHVDVRMGGICPCGHVDRCLPGTCECPQLLHSTR